MLQVRMHPGDFKERDSVSGGRKLPWKRRRELERGGIGVERERY